MLPTVAHVKNAPYTSITVRKAANSLPKKTVVLDTGFVSKGTMVPLSNSPEKMFIATINAKKKNPNLPTVSPTAKSGFKFGSELMLVIGANKPGNIRLANAKTTPTRSKPANFFFRILHNNSYLMIAHKRVFQLKRFLPFGLLSVEIIRGSLHFG